MRVSGILLPWNGVLLVESLMIMSVLFWSSDWEKSPALSSAVGIVEF